MKYAIGLDIGIASVGWAVVALDYEENPWGIIKMGSRIFDKAENSKDGASLALPRREARSARRRLRRHKHRLERIKNLLLQSKLLTINELENLYEGQLTDIYALRVEALERKVNNTELARILLHLAQRRGFKSNRKSEASEKETGLLLNAVNENKRRMEKNNYRTVGEMFYKDSTFAMYKRNKKDSYLTTVARSLIEDEAKIILEKQFNLGNTLVDEKFTESYLSILLSQRQFDEGPGKPSRYNGNQIENMIGPCTLEANEKRAAKACYSFEYFNLLQKVNHLRLMVKSENIPLDIAQKEKIIKLAHQKADLNYNHIRKELGLNEDVSFNTIYYANEDVEKIEKKTKFNYLPVYHQIKKVLNKIEANYIEKISPATLDEIGKILTIYKGDNKRRSELAKINLNLTEIEQLLTISNIAKFGHLSLKALRKIIPFLEQGFNYNEACAKAGFDFRGHSNNEKSFLLPAYKKEEMDNITSPVVRRAIAQTIKVINAIIREQKCSPSFIKIELAREMAKDFEERKKLEKSMKENQVKNDKLMEKLRQEFHIVNPTGLDLLKLKLWEQQDGISPYSQKAIPIEKLFTEGYVDIDHIAPYSITFDDSLKNKVLVLSEENREKGNRLPIPYLRQIHGEKAAEKFIVWVNNNIRDYKKRLKLLKEKFTDDDLKGFKERNLQDTKTMSRFLYNYINDYLLFAPSDTGKKKKVTAVNGSVTSYLRKRWGINKIRANGDTHHAVDAVVIACTTDKMIQEVAQYSRYKEVEYTPNKTESLLSNTITGEIIKRFPYPWENFRDELEARLSSNPKAALQKLNLVFYSTRDLNDVQPIFVSRMPRRKITGAAHKATIKSAKAIEQNITISKTALTSLKLDKNGEIANYYAPESDTLLYNALKARLNAYNNNAKEAFAIAFYKPKADGSNGPLVKTVKTFEKATLTVPVQQNTGVADNDSMVRIDIFKVPNDGYYMVPIYVADTLKKELPNKAVIQGKNYTDWLEMDEKNFLFSVYPNDLLKVTHKKGMKFTLVNKESNLPKEYLTKEALVYYNSADISTANIKIINNDNTYTTRIGIKTLANLEKYEVDILGNYHQVRKETRQKFHFSKR